MTLRVLLDISVLSQPTLSRGVGRYVRNLALSLFGQAMHDPSIELLATAGRPVLGVPEVSADVPAVLDWVTSAPLDSHPLSWVRSGHRAISRAVHRTRPDVLHTLDPDAAGLQDFPCPHVVTCHHVDSDVEPDSWHGADARVPKKQRQIFASADHVIATSRATAAELITRLNVPRTSISVVYHGLKLSTWTTGPDAPFRRRKLGVTGPYLLCVGGVDERKNVAHIVESLSRAHRLMGRSDLKLIWVGDLDNQETLKLKRAAAVAGLSNHLHLVGYVSDENLAALYGGAVALLFVSRREGFGFPLVEAMASGCPVITSNRSSLVEVAQEAALTVDPLDTSAIADAIVLLADDQMERKRLAEKGRQRARDFSLGQMVQGTLAAYRLAKSRA